VDFHRSFGMFWAALVVTLLGVGGTTLVIVWFGTGGRIPVFFFLSPFAALFGVYAMIVSLLPLRMRIDENGIRLCNRTTGVKLTTPVPWPAIAAITIERKPDQSEKSKAPYVVLWPRGPIPGLKESRGFHRGQWIGFPLIQTDDVKESQDQLMGALRHYAGPLFQAPQQYPGQQQIIR
jgi:hypothetical protein